ncbi:RNA-binding protein [Bathymodiolus japonicus methanotrophic gill symbiont]|uniref:RNA-binding protein n=1 Tax=Bathymodiolus japonicus methanotrophic gill symbiont TaxID=113269 RepID=UPI001C8D6656|nr:RNA-binding protein [Bathymodiolus japonicus methanotrophic gill symbiont]
MFRQLLKSSWFWFSKKAAILDVKVVHLQEVGLEHSEFHGLVSIEPDAAAEKVIKRLNKKTFMGRPVVVREYHRRDWHNDLRVEYHPQTGDTPCQRKTDRRRKNLEVVKEIRQEFSGDKSFHRQHK